MRYFYLFLAVIGLVLPYYFFLAFLGEHGMDLKLFVEFLFANPISAFFVMDLIIATIVFFAFLFRESRRVGVRYWWLFIIFSLTIGLSFAFPLFLYTREARLVDQ